MITGGSNEIHGTQSTVSTPTRTGKETTMASESTTRGCMIEDLEVPGATHALESAAAGTCTTTCTCSAAAQCE
jgi:hypothetical protein